MKPCKLQLGDRLTVQPTFYGAGTDGIPAMLGTVMYIHPLHRFVVLDFGFFREAFLLSADGDIEQ